MLEQYDGLKIGDTVEVTDEQHDRFEERGILIELCQYGEPVVWFGVDDYENIHSCDLKTSDEPIDLMPENSPFQIGDTVKYTEAAIKESLSGSMPCPIPAEKQREIRATVIFVADYGCDYMEVLSKYSDGSIGVDESGDLEKVDDGLCKRCRQEPGALGRDKNGLCHFCKNERSFFDE